ncbi:hypothetical protein [Proteus mirabilis]|uniref:hypothetical protein n=1 Tax=Proteus mirabilis TaxID=584 RepID=UPI0034D6DA5B
MKSIFLLDLESGWVFNSVLFISSRKLDFTIRCEDKDGVEVDLSNRISDPWLNDILYDDNGKFVFKFGYDFCREDVRCEFKKPSMNPEKRAILRFTGGLKGFGLPDIIAKVLGYTRIDELSTRRISSKNIKIDIQPASNDTYYVHSITVDFSHLINSKQKGK